MLPGVGRLRRVRLSLPSFFLLLVVVDQRRRRYNATVLVVETDSVAQALKEGFSKRVIAGGAIVLVYTRISPAAAVEFMEA